MNDSVKAFPCQSLVHLVQIVQIVLVFAFGFVVSEFLFLIHVQKTILMKILMSCVMNSSRHRKCFVRGFIHSLFVSKTLTRSFLARSGF